MRSSRRRTAELGVITLYAFSVENWKRPRFEVATLMLLKEYLRKELATLMDNNIRFSAMVASKVSILGTAS